MKKSLNIFIFLLISLAGFSQTDFSRIDEKSKTCPESIKTFPAIASYLTRNLSSEKEKARAIYIWIAHNIKYDLGMIDSNKEYNSKEEIIEEVMKTRQGVCQHYSELFHAMSRSVGLKSYFISGYTRDYTGKIADMSHGWNALQLGNEFFMIDVTWAAGYITNGKYYHKFQNKYFLTTPREFIKDHMPFDPIWQFLDNPINNSEFIANDFSRLVKKGNYAFQDSIRKYEEFDELTRLERTNKRIYSCGIKHKLIQQHFDFNQVLITNKKYNQAIEILNKGIQNYNYYISCKNKQFQNPKLEDSELLELIDSAAKPIYLAKDLFSRLLTSDRELNKLILVAKKKMPSLIADIEREKDFVAKYLKKWKPLRKTMFYVKK